MQTAKMLPDLLFESIQEDVKNGMPKLKSPWKSFYAEDRTPVKQEQERIMEWENDAKTSITRKEWRSSSALRRCGRRKC